MCVFAGMYSLFKRDVCVKVGKVEDSERFIKGSEPQRTLKDSLGPTQMSLQYHVPNTVMSLQYNVPHIVPRNQNSAPHLIPQP